MAVKPIFSAEISGGDKAMAFFAAFEKYNQGLKEAEPRLKATERATHAVALATAEIADEQARVNDLLDEANKAEEKAAKERQKQEEERLRKAKQQLDRIKDTAEGISNFLFKGTESLLKWAGIGGALGGLIGGGGLFGLDRLAASVSDTRRTSLGLGIGAGQLNAFRLNFGRYGLDTSYLQSVSDAQNDLTRRWAFTAMGVQGAESKNPADLAAELASRAREIWNRGDKTESYARAHGLTEFFTLSQLRELGNLPAGELQAAVGGFHRDAAALARDDATSKAWQDFNVSLGRAGQEIENSLVIGLERAHLPDALGRLSKVVADAASQFLSSPEFGKWVKEASDGIHWLGDYLSSPDARKNFRTFVQDVGDVSDALVSFLKKIGVIKDHDTPAERPKDTEGFRVDHSGILGKLFGYSNTNDREQAIYNFLRSPSGGSWSDAQASGIIANMLSENNTLEPTRWGDSGKAVGIGQWHPDRQAEFKKFAGYAISDPNIKLDKQLADEAAFYVYELMRGQFKKAGDDLRKATTKEQAAYIVSKEDERPGLTPQAREADARTRAALAGQINLKVTVSSPPGSDVHAQAAAATH